MFDGSGNGTTNRDDRTGRMTLKGISFVIETDDKNRGMRLLRLKENRPGRNPFTCHSNCFRDSFCPPIHQAF